MVPLLTRAQMVALDRHTIDEVGIPALVLMETAGRKVADVAQELHDQDGRPVLALAGTGNNGGDAVVAARHLQERGVPVSVLVLGRQDRLTEDAAAQVRMADRLGVSIEYVDGDAAVRAAAARLSRSGPVIDGLFGTGLTREVEGWRRSVVERLAAADDHPVVAVDIPSGVDADSGQVLGAAVPAEVTVTFQFPKLGHAHYPGRALTGTLVIADIGIPPSRLPLVDPKVHIVSTARLREAFPPRTGPSHKGSYGHLLVVGGAPDRPGAVLLAGRAALRTGAGLVTVGSDRTTIERLSGHLEALMGITLGIHRADADAVLATLQTRTALAVGPSLPPDWKTRAMVKTVLSDSRVPAVVDAGALAALGTDTEWLSERGAPTVLTPHPGEMARLTGMDTAAVQGDRLGVALALAQQCGVHVVLKGASTVVAHPDGRAGIVVAGNPGMATGGTGDVLTGMIGALLAQGVDPTVAAEAGALAHALAGDRAADVHGQVGLTAPDLIDHIPAVVRTHAEEGSEDESG